MVVKKLKIKKKKRGKENGKNLPNKGKVHEDNNFFNNYSFLISFINFSSNHWEKFQAVDRTNTYDDINDLRKNSC